MALTMQSYVRVFLKPCIIRFVNNSPLAVSMNHGFDGGDISFTYKHISDAARELYVAWMTKQRRTNRKCPLFLCTYH